MLIRAEWDRFLAGILIAAGAVLVIVCWAGVSGTPFVADQLAYIASGGIGGLFFLALGLALLMSADHHDEWRKLDAIEAALRETSPVAEAPPTPPVPAQVSPAQLNAVAEGRKRGLSVLTLGGGVSAVIMIVGWVHSSGSGRQGVAAEGLTMSAAGLLVAVAAVAGFLVPSRSRLAARRAFLLRRFALADGAALARSGAPAMNGASGDVVFVASGLTRYHRPGCPAVKGLAAQPVSRADVSRELEPCDLCAWGDQQ
ncbi:MAG: hypothetical protein AB1679_03975 [Actinomycetota bacterium]